MIWDPFEDLKKFQKEMNRLFEGFFGESEKKLLETGKELMEYRRPLTDVVQTDKEVIVTLEMPGMSKEDIQLNITDETIEVKAEKKYEIEVEKKGFPPIHHSKSYVEANRPSYRVVLKSLWEESKIGRDFV